VWAWYGISGEAVSAGCVKQVAGGLAAAERTACNVVLLQKAGASDRQCDGRDACLHDTPARQEGPTGTTEGCACTGWLGPTSVYKRKKLESTEYEEMRKGKKRTRKDVGGETHG
jgi:hypothetical protein